MKKIAISLCLLVGIGCAFSAGLGFLTVGLPGESSNVEELNAVLATATWYSCAESTQLCTAVGTVSSAGCSASTVGSTCGTRGGTRLNKECRESVTEWSQNKPCKFSNVFCTNYYVCVKVPGWLLNSYSCAPTSGTPPADTLIECEVQ